MRQTRNGARGDRWNALWGTGNRGGESRSKERARRGHGFLTTVMALVALTVPIAAVAGPGPSGSGSGATHVAGDLLKIAKDNPGQKVRVIIQSKHGADAASTVARAVGGSEHAKLGLVNGVAVELPALAVERLTKVQGLIVTPDSPVKASTLTNTQLWPYEAGLAQLWSKDALLTMPAIAIVDSGIEKARLDFGARVLADVKLNGESPLSGDTRGHGTFVAGIAAGAGYGNAGAAPTAPIVSLDVMDNKGMAYVSDVIEAADWIMQNKAAYNIRVANFSLHAGRAGSIHYDPLSRAVEKLWLNGVVVVAAAGNYGSATGPSGVVSAPGNNPWVITVGALDIGTAADIKDDSISYWSAYGHTLDGFSKPEVSAAGRYMTGPVPTTSTLYAERADRIVAPGYLQLSGTSFAAPAVAGAAAKLLARYPNWTPDQVKGALMLTARPVPGAAPGAAGVGQITVTSAVQVTAPPNPNAALRRFVVQDASGLAAFDVEAWGAAAWADAAWADAAWADAAWSSAAWSSAAWADAAWSSAAWADAAWADAAWADAAWADTATEDNAATDTSSGNPTLTPAAAEYLKSDPALRG
jgi:serine protease AprX